LKKLKGKQIVPAIVEGEKISIGIAVNRNDIEHLLLPVTS
jgi:hypothetical protein